jgi:SAM-dependent methyltransferase
MQPSARDLLRAGLEEEYRTYFGLPSPEFINGVVDAWMADDVNSKHRFDSIQAYLPTAKRVLDMASGCGTAVFYGLLHGYDMEGIDPEAWKHRFNEVKAAEHGYPEEWKRRFHVGVGEELPFPDNDFDCVTTYQTLEHVQDLRRVVLEMVRVTRPGGGIHIRCPDYTGTFEGHYRLPWLPLFPRPLAKAYLRALGRPTKGLDTIGYVTQRKLFHLLKEAQVIHPNWNLRIVDIDRDAFIAHKKANARAVLPGAYRVAAARRYARSIFRQETNINLFVYVLAK